MLLSSKDGYMCDCCGLEQRHDFTYYSLDFQYVEVKGGHFPPGWLDHPGQAVFSIDACGACMAIVEGAVKVNFRPIAGGVSCELCPAVMTGRDFVFYCCRVTKAIVSLERGRYRCACGVETPQLPDKACKRCGRQKFSRLADTSTDDKYLQVVVCAIDYGKLVENAMRLRKAASMRHSTGS